MRGFVLISRDLVDASVQLRTHVWTRRLMVSRRYLKSKRRTYGPPCLEIVTCVVSGGIAAGWALFPESPWGMIYAVGARPEEKQFWS